MEGKGERGGEVEGRVRRGRIGKKEDVVGRPSFGGERLGRRWRGGEGELIWKRGGGVVVRDTIGRRLGEVE